ncbi:LANO_0H07492g1_1 [Lachancea nothofagi CBS 11611]|uniref:LANO_0H07492g1_1 n=1 Tax=Lachancea nothofagi CBS 11611 TaxID=1266666 RepID=A0A1G4KLM4_9SACH|nr:LANO_0H07492g1_1 [Lachancea nothofagi CBS 11611]
MSRDSSLVPLTAQELREPALAEQPEPFDDPTGYNPDVPIAIDFGSSEVRAGFGNQEGPSHIFTNRLARWRDRKRNKNLTFIGNDTNLDLSVRLQARSPYDGAIVSNWDYAEEIMEYTFHHLGVNNQDGVPNPILMTEKLATLQSQRENWYQLLFECFGTSQVTFGLDSLFSFHANNDSSASGLVISSGNEDTHVIPVVDGKGALSEAKRINWGGRQSVDYLANLLALKYPYFPIKPSTQQFQSLYHDYCYISPDYQQEIQKILSMEELETKNVVVEAPFSEIVQPEKSEEEIRLQAEKRRETGRRLQEQARQRRKEKLVQKEEEYEYYTQLKEQMKDQPKKTILSTLQNAGFDDEQDFRKYVNGLEKTLKKAQVLDAGDEDEETSSNKFELVEVPDEQLNEDEIKEKRKQRLMKANLDARIKAKEERIKKEQEEEETRIKDETWRKEDLHGWIKDKRNRLSGLIKSRKSKLKIKSDMKDRKSHAAQKRMKNIATLAEEDSRSSTKRSRQQATVDNDPNDTFGANDEDWLVYNDITSNAEALDQAIEEEYNVIVELEKLLLEYDPNFTEEDTLDAQYDWRNSTLHLFLRGPRPHDSEDMNQQHQMHLNVERIRVPEVVFQPSMGALDQAGIIEICETILLKKFDSNRRELSPITQNLASNIFLTGGNMRVPGMKERIVREFTGLLPMGTNLNVRLAKNPAVDAWKGMAKLSQAKDQYKKTYITKQEYQEYGADYIKEHNLGNVSYV